MTSAIQHTVAFRLQHPAGSDAEREFLTAAIALADIPVCRSSGSCAR